MNELLFAFSAASTAAILGYGFLIGLQHATDADHLAAVGTIVSERKSVWSSMLLGGVWGLGHTISLVAAGVFVLLLNFQISEQTERILEFGVGVMLLFLGLNVLRKITRGGKIHFHTHEHGARASTRMCICTSTAADLLSVASTPLKATASCQISGMSDRKCRTGRSFSASTELTGAAGTQARLHLLKSPSSRLLAPPRGCYGIARGAGVESG